METEGTVMYRGYRTVPYRGTSEGYHRNIFFPSLGIEIRQRQASRAVNDIVVEIEEKP